MAFIGLGVKCTERRCPGCADLESPHHILTSTVADMAGDVAAGSKTQDRWSCDGTALLP